MSASSADLRERVIGFIVWSSVAASVLAPLLYFANLQYNLSRLFHATPLPGSYEDTLAKVKDPYTGGDSDGIKSGMSAAQRALQITRIRKFTATPEQAAGWARHVQFLSISFSAPQLGSGDSGKSKDGYRELDLNFTQRADGPTDDALVIIADQPIRWSIKADGLPERARVGFEGPMAIDVTAAPPGVIAGYRIGAFGGGETALPITASRINDTSGNFCRSILSWTKYFGVSPQDIQVFALTDPKHIWASGAEWNSDAASVAGTSRQSIVRQCTGM